MNNPLFIIVWISSVIIITGMLILFFTSFSKKKSIHCPNCEQKVPVSETSKLKIDKNRILRMCDTCFFNRELNLEIVEKNIRKKVKNKRKAKQIITRVKEFNRKEEINLG